MKRKIIYIGILTLLLLTTSLAVARIDLTGTYHPPQGSGTFLYTDWFDQNLNTTTNATFYNVTAGGFFIGDGSLLTGIAGTFTYSDWFNQNLNTTADVTFNSITGDGSGLTGLPETFTYSNWFNQNLNTTNNVTFTWLDILNDLNVTYNITATNITAYAFFGDGGNLTNINASNIIGNLSNENISANNISEYLSNYGIHFRNNVTAHENVTVDGATQHYANVTISGKTKDDQPHLMLRAYDTVGFDNYKQSEIRFFDNNNVVIGNIWYNKDLLTTTQGINIVSDADILLDAKGGAGNIVLNGITWWKDDIKILLGKDAIATSARFEFYANNNNGYLNPLNWGLGGTSHPISFTFNDGLEDTDFIVNSSLGNALIIDGETGDTNITGTLRYGNSYYAEAWYHNHPGVAISFATANHFYNLSFNATRLNGFTCVDNENLTCVIPGLYSTNFVACGSGQNNHEYILSIGINGQNQEHLAVHKKLTSGGDILGMSGTGLIQVNATDTVTLMIKDWKGVGAGTYHTSNINLIRMGDVL